MGSEPATPSPPPASSPLALPARQKAQHVLSTWPGVHSLHSICIPVVFVCIGTLALRRRVAMKNRRRSPCNSVPTFFCSAGVLGSSRAPFTVKIGGRDLQFCQLDAESTRWLTTPSAAPQQCEQLLRELRSDSELQEMLRLPQGVSSYNRNFL